MIRRAAAADLDAVSKIYEHIHALEQKKQLTTGWIAGVYPVRATAEAALQREDLFVYEQAGSILASGVINQIQVDVYGAGGWLYPAEPEQVMVLHTLTVEPEAASRGIGSSFVAYYEDYARSHGCTVLRMDTNAKNAAARRFYAGLGYREAGIVPCVFNGIPDVRLVLLEKNL